MGGDFANNRKSAGKLLRDSTITDRVRERVSAETTGQLIHALVSDTHDNVKPHGRPRKKKRNTRQERQDENVIGCSSCNSLCRSRYFIAESDIVLEGLRRRFWQYTWQFKPSSDQELSIRHSAKCRRHIVTISVPFDDVDTLLVRPIECQAVSRSAPLISADTTFLASINISLRKSRSLRNPGGSEQTACLRSSESC